MILKNRNTRESINITYPEFRKQFSKEIQTAFESFLQSQLKKPFFNYKDDNTIEVDFYFDIRFNFNNFGNSAWYIERM